MSYEPEKVRHNAKIPEGAMVVSVVELVTYITPEGTQGATYHREGDGTYADTVGWLEWVKTDLVRDWIDEHPATEEP